MVIKMLRRTLLSYYRYLILYIIVVFVVLHIFVLVIEFKFNIYQKKELQIFSSNTHFSILEKKAVLIDEKYENTDKKMIHKNLLFILNSKSNVLNNSKKIRMPNEKQYYINDLMVFERKKQQEKTKNDKFYEIPENDDKNTNSLKLATLDKPYTVRQTNNDTNRTKISTTTKTLTDDRKFSGIKDKDGKLNMSALHLKVWKSTTLDEELLFYTREKHMEELFREPLDIKRDREKLETLFPRPNEKYDRVVPQLALKLLNTTKKTILLWRGNTEKPENFISDNCNVKDCIFTYDLSFINTADAILFNQRIIKFNTKKSDNYNKNQIKVMFQLESARNQRRISYGIQFNWTFTYRRDSVLNAPYAKFVPYPQFSSLPNRPIRNFAEGKTKMVAWFVSNCVTPNRRIEYVDELEKHVKVDIYGRCGFKNCERSDLNCFSKLKKEYKFYLAFENTNCKDYITEKLYQNAYQNDIIPIVMGAHPDEYKQLVPPRSYIHIDMFESPKQLADYLIFLDKNDDLYNSYFLWKNTGEFINTKSLCRLCAMVHLAPHFPMWYNNLDKWWDHRETCHNVHPENHELSWGNRKEVSNNAKYIQYGYNRTMVDES